MKVQGEEILSDVTEKTSRNLKATAAIVMAVKLFKVNVQDLEILSVNLPSNLFDVVSFTLLAYMMVVLMVYWYVDYLLWRDGPILAAKDKLDEYLRGLNHMMPHKEELQARGVDRNIKYIDDHFASLKKEVLEYRRSIAQTTGAVLFSICVLHLAVPLLLGFLAALMVGEGAWTALKLSWHAA